MRILLTSNASYAPPRGGSTRSNLVWLRLLTEHGHTCRVLSAALEEDNEHIDSGIAIRSVRNLAQRSAIVSQEIHDWRPDFVLVSSEDLSHMLLRTAGRAAPEGIVYLGHTPQFFPFGPESWNRDPHAAVIVREARAVVCIGRHMAGYVKQHLGVEAAVIHPPIYGTPPYARLGRYDAEWILMINPCLVKGIGIFIELARRFRGYAFAALAGWGTTGLDREALAAVRNIRVLENVPDIEQVLARTRILLMPSLWYEGFGLIAMEAMLRAIPVVSSDSGGLADAKAGTGFVIPVAGIERYLPEFDEMHMPKPVMPEQNLEPWVRELGTLLADKAAWEEESERSREAALRFVAGLDPGGLEHLLVSLVGGGKPHAAAHHTLTAEQRTLLLRRMRERGRK